MHWMTVAVELRDLMLPMGLARLAGCGLHFVTALKTVR